VKKQEFITNVAMMSASMLLIRVVTMSFQIYTSARIGAEGMGLFHLIFSVYALFVTLATSGISLAVTRLTSEQLGKCGGTTGHIAKKCITLSLMISIPASLLLFCSAGMISSRFLGDTRAATALRILAPSLPFLAVSSVLRGYFIGLGKVTAATLGQMTEEFSSIAITILLLKRLIGTPYAVLSLIVGQAVAEVVACTLEFGMYVIGNRAQCQKRVVIRFSDILSISAPVALGSYLRSGLVTLENLLIPSGLAASGIRDALARYGVVKGMAMPILFFPTVFLQSFISLLVPEIARRSAAKNNRSVCYTAEKSIEYALAFGVPVCGIFLCFHWELSLQFYQNTEVGLYLCMLAALAVPMYLDSVTDGLLKGLDQQVSSLRYNIIDSILRIIAIHMIVPRFGITGYIGILYGSELLNLTLSMRRLIKVTGIHPHLPQNFIRPLFCVVPAFILHLLIPTWGLWADMAIFSASYLLFYIIIAACTKGTHGYLN